MRHRIAFVLAVLLPLSACGDDARTAAPTATIDTLPNGALLVRNGTQGAWDSAATWSLVEETRIGSMDGEGPDVFAGVRDIEVDALGRVWVLDPQSKAIRVFEANGDFVRTVGRAGAGPGEFEDPIGMEFDPQGRLWVQDPRNARFTLFDTAGAFITTKRRESNMFSWVWQGGIASDGRVFDIDVVFPTQQSGESTTILLERDSAGSVTDTIDLPEYEELFYELVSNDGRSRSRTNVPFSPGLSWAISSDGEMWFGVSDDYRLVKRSLDGDTLMVLEKEWTPVPVRSEEVDSILGHGFYAEMAQRGASLDRSVIPATKPAWEDFWLDDDGLLWVRLPRATDGSTRADVFDRDGIYQGTVTLPQGFVWFAPPVIRDDRYYAVVSDEFEVTYVVVGRVEGKNARSLESAAR